MPINDEWIPVAIRATNDTHYEVEFGREAGQVHSFVFTVTEDGIASVAWPHEFWQATGGQLDAVTPLFQAILAMHQARREGIRLRG